MSGINRDITLCVPRLQAAWQHLSEQYPLLYPNDPAIMLVETFRSAAVQRAYYAQGRQKLVIVNSLRRGAGLWPIDEVENRSKVTQRLPGSSQHEHMDAQGKPAGKAFDIGFHRGGVMDYTPEHYARAAAILFDAFPDVRWGGDWNHNGKTEDEKFVDRPHFEVK